MKKTEDQKSRATVLLTLFNTVYSHQRLHCHFSTVDCLCSDINILIEAATGLNGPKLPQLACSVSYTYILQYILHIPVHCINVLVQWDVLLRNNDHCLVNLLNVFLVSTQIFLCIVPNSLLVHVKIGGSKIYSQKFIVQYLKRFGSYFSCRHCMGMLHIAVFGKFFFLSRRVVKLGSKIASKQTIPWGKRACNG
jgi:hypothetical protein